MAITWRNIESDATRGAAGLMEVARRSLNDGFDVLNKTLETRNEIQDQNWEARKQTNTNAFLDRLAQFKTPEELAAAQASGELAALKQSFGGQVDAAAIRDAEANMQQKLIERITAQNQYGDYNLDRSQRDQINAIQARAAAGDAGAIEALKQYSNNPKFAEYLKNTQGYLDLYADNKREDKKVLQDGQRIALEEERVGLERARNEREEYVFNTKRTLQEQTEASENAALQLLTQLDPNTPDASGILKLQGQFEQIANDNGWNNSTRNAGQKVITDAYSRLTGLTPEQTTAVSNLTFKELELQDPNFKQNMKTQFGWTDAEYADFHKNNLDYRVSDWAENQKREADKESHVYTKFKDYTEDQAYTAIFKKTPDEQDESAAEFNKALGVFKEKNGYAGQDIGGLLMYAGDKYGVDDPDFWDRQVRAGKLVNLLEKANVIYRNQKAKVRQAEIARRFADNQANARTSAYQAENLRYKLNTLRGQ